MENNSQPIQKKSKLLIAAYIIILLPIFVIPWISDGPKEVYACYQEGWEGLCQLLLMMFIYLETAALILSFALTLISIVKKIKNKEKFGLGIPILFLLFIVMVILIFYSLYIPIKLNIKNY